MTRKWVAKGRATTYWLFPPPPCPSLLSLSCTIDTDISTKFKRYPKSSQARNNVLHVGYVKKGIHNNRRSYVCVDHSCLAFFHAEGFEGDTMSFSEVEGPRSSNFLLDVPRSWRTWQRSPLVVHARSKDHTFLFGVEVVLEEEKTLTKATWVMFSETNVWFTLTIRWILGRLHTIGLLTTILNLVQEKCVFGNNLNNPLSL